MIPDTCRAPARAETPASAERPASEAPDGVVYEVEVHGAGKLHLIIDLERGLVGEDDGKRLTARTRLGYQQCPGCPLTADDRNTCPAAMDIQSVADRLPRAPSHTPCTVRVVASGREYRKECSLQTALASLLGLILARGECPRFAPLRSLTATHLPFATTRESAERVVGNVVRYVLKQDLDDLTELNLLNALRDIYKDLQMVNEHMGRRLEGAGHEPILNALNQLNSHALLATERLRHGLREYFAMVEKSR